MTMSWVLPALLAAASSLIPASAIKVYEVRPSQADPGGRQYDDPSYVMAAPGRGHHVAGIVVLAPAGIGLRRPDLIDLDGAGRDQARRGRQQGGQDPAHRHRQSPPADHRPN